MISHCKTVKVEDKKKDKNRWQSCFLAVGPGPPGQKFMDPRMGQLASKLGPLSACQQNVIRMAFQWRADNGPIVRAYWVSISFESYMYLFLDPGYVLFWCSVCFSERLIIPAFFFRKKGYINLVPNLVRRPSVCPSVRHVSCKCISS